MTKTNAILGMLAAVVVGGIVGYVAASAQYVSQINAAKKLFPSITMMNSVSGTVKSVSGNVVTLETTKSPNPFENLPGVRQINVTGATKIVRNEKKDDKVFQKEMDAYNVLMNKQKAGGNALNPLDFPKPFAEVQISVSDLKPGDMVSVDAGKDIKLAVSFDAVRITVNGNANPMAPVASGTAPVVNTPPAAPAGMTAPVVNTPPPAKPQ